MCRKDSEEIPQKLIIYWLKPAFKTKFCCFDKHIPHGFLTENFQAQEPQSEGGKCHGKAVPGMGKDHINGFE